MPSSLSVMATRPSTQTTEPEILARGPWPLEQVKASWLDETFTPSDAHAQAADAAIAKP
jgi:hypothetical protein